MVVDAKPAEKAPTELGLLWRDAFQGYNDAVGKKGLKLSLDGSHLVTSLADVVGSVDTSKKSFEKWRNDGGNWDKARQFIGKNLDYAQRIGDQVASSAAASFPPASAIWTVATYAIKACQAQSKDYDQLLSLIGEAGSFLDTPDYRGKISRLRLLCRLCHRGINLPHGRLCYSDQVHVGRKAVKILA